MHFATRRKVTGSIPDGVIGVFHWRNPSGRTMNLGLTEPLTEMSTRNISWGVKAAFVHKSHIYLIRVILSVPLPKYFLRDQIKNEMGGGMWHEWGQENIIQGFSVET
jgi:hypothetical protein